MKKSLLLVVFSLLTVSGTAQKFENVLRYGTNYKPRFEDRAQQLFPINEQVYQAPEKGNDVQAFAPLLNLNFFNPVFGYYLSGIVPIVYDPSVNSVFIIYNEQTSSGSGDIGVNCKLFQSATNLKTFNSAFKMMTTFGSDFLGMPQLAVMNPDKAKIADGLHFMMIARQYLKASQYRYTTQTMFLKTSAAVADPFPLEGPQDNNPSGYTWGSGSMVSFSGGDAQGCVMAGVLDPPDNVQYGQYGAFVYEATTQEPQSSVPASWANSQFRSAPALTSSYNGPMYSDADAEGNVYAACNSIFADDQNNRVIAFSKSTNLGKTWSDFTRMPKSTLDNYATSRGQVQATFVQPYQQDAFIVTGKDKFSYFARVALFDKDDALQALDIVEFEFDNGSWTTRGIAGFSDVPTVFVDNDSVDQSTNYTKLKAFRTMNPTGNELEAARTADGSSVILKWIDYNLDLGATQIVPPQTVLVQDQQTGSVSEATLDSVFTTDIFLSSRSLNGGDWAQPSNLTNDKVYDKGTHMPRLVPAIDKIPMISMRPVSKSNWSSTSQKGTMIKAQPDDYITRIYNLWSTVNYSLFSGTTSVEDNTPSTLNFALNAPAPSPANDEVDITFNTLQAGHVRITIANMLGQTVATVVDATMDGGMHGSVFNTSAMPSGSYIMTMNMNGHSVAQPFIVAH